MLEMPALLPLLIFRRDDSRAIPFTDTFIRITNHQSFWHHRLAGYTNPKRADQTRNTSWKLLANEGICRICCHQGTSQNLPFALSCILITVNYLQYACSCYRNVGSTSKVREQLFWEALNIF